MVHRVFSIEDVADFLRVRVEDIEEWVRRKEIPFERIGQRIVFRRHAVELWASRRVLNYSPARLGDYHAKSTRHLNSQAGPKVLISNLLPPEQIAPALPCRTKPSLLREMVRRADDTGLLNFPDDLRQALEKRERNGSTALAGGVAMLHVAHTDPYLFEDSFLVLGRTIQPIPFGSPDGRTTDIFFLVCACDERLHLHLLARLCMICYHTNILFHLREEKKAEAMHRVLTECEQDMLRRNLSEPSASSVYG